MKSHWIIILLVFSILGIVHAQDADTLWSNVDNGLRGRLTVALPAKGNSPFFRVYIELQNVGNVLGQKTINFSPEKMIFKITSKDGGLLPPDQGLYDGIMPGWEPISLPLEGTIKFPIVCQGLAVRPGTKAVIDLDTPRTWIIPQDGRTYYLSGSLTIPRDLSGPSQMVWYGTLHFPPAKIPNVK